MTIVEDKYDYRLLHERIKSYGFNNTTLADKLGIGRSTLYTKLHNQSEFTQNEIRQVSKILEIKPVDLASYFFAPIVQKTVQKIET